MLTLSLGVGCTDGTAKNDSKNKQPDDDKTVNVPGFNHAHYAMTRAAELCGGTK